MNKVESKDSESIENTEWAGRRTFLTTIRRSLCHRKKKTPASVRSSPKSSVFELFRAPRFGDLQDRRKDLGIEEPHAYYGLVEVGTIH